MTLEEESLADLILRHPNTFIMGSPESGTTAVLAETARRASSAGHHVVFFSADSSRSAGIDTGDAIVLADETETLEWWVQMCSPKDLMTGTKAPLYVIVEDLTSLICPASPEESEADHQQEGSEEARRGQLREVLHQLLVEEDVKLVVSASDLTHSAVHPFLKASCRIHLTPAPALHQQMLFGHAPFSTNDPPGEYAIVAEADDWARMVKPKIGSAADVGHVPSHEELLQAYTAHRRVSSGFAIGHEEAAEEFHRGISVLRSSAKVGGSF
ncbi:hypothetical protein [Nesterenkonia rhizosphaerae]